MRSQCGKKKKKDEPVTKTRYLTNEHIGKSYSHPTKHGFLK